MGFKRQPNKDLAWGSTATVACLQKNLRDAPALVTTGNWQLATGNWAGYFDQAARAMLANPRRAMPYGLLQHWPPLLQGRTHRPWLGCA